MKKYELTNIERQVRANLRDWFGPGRVDQATPVEPGVWMARLLDGGLAYVIVEDDGSISIKEQEAVC